ncbi:MAG: hypothetical protein NC548_10665 [Lachnospiraceae bacterium]|nr:hypothetical protein [Lachnospiraceae bacterium]
MGFEGATGKSRIQSELGEQQYFDNTFTFVTYVADALPSHYVRIISESTSPVIILDRLDNYMFPEVINIIDAECNETMFLVDVKDFVNYGKFTMHLVHPILKPLDVELEVVY